MVTIDVAKSEGQARAPCSTPSPMQYQSLRASALDQNIRKRQPFLCNSQSCSPHVSASKAACWQAELPSYSYRSFTLQCPAAASPVQLQSSFPL